MKIKSTLLLIVALFYSLGFFAQNYVDVTSYGATVNNSSNDDKAGIRAAIQACKTVSNPILRFQEGTYHINSEDGTDNFFYIDNINNLTIEGSGSTIMVMGGRYVNTRNMFLFWNCKNIRIQNLNTDYDSPPFSQTRVVASGSGYLDLQLQPGFKMLLNNGTQKTIRYYTEYDPILGQQISEKHSWDGSKTWSWVNQGQNVIRMNDNQFNFPVGTYILLRHASYHGYTYFFSRGCEDVVLDNVNVYKASGYPFYANEGVKNMSFLNTGIRKSSPSMWVTSTADGAHLLDARGEILFDNCHFEGMCDDGINLHSYFFNLTSVNSNTVNAVSVQPWHQLSGYKIGDTVEFFEKSTNASVGTNIITNISNISSGNMRVQFQNNVPSGISNYKMAVTSCIGSLTVRNSTFKGNRSRAILVSTSDVLIENCTFERTGSSAILFEVWDNWEESTPSRNAVVRNNTFNDVLYHRFNNNAGGIQFYNGNAFNGDCDIWKNITITGNTFRNMHVPALVAEQVSGLVITNNTIENFTAGGNLIRYGTSKNVTISGNIGASIDNRGGNCPNDAVIAVTGVIVAPETAILSPTQTLQLTADILPSNASNQSVTWTSSNPSVVSVNSNTGLVTAVTVGSPVTITATTTDGSYTDTSIITVENNVAPEGVESITGPAEVSRGQIITVNVAYSATTSRDIIVYLQENGTDLNADGNSYTAFGEARVTVNAGQTTIPIELTVNTNAPLSSSYRHTTFLTTVGGDWGQRIGSDTAMPGVSISESLSNISVKDQKYSVYPNPVEDFIQVSLSNSSFSVIQFRVYDMIGQLVFEQKGDSSKDKWQIDLGHLSQGIHVLEITTNDQVVYHKLIKK